MSAKVLVIGAGGREHALSWKLIQSSHVEHVFVSPGNCGTALQDRTSNVDLDLKNFNMIGIWCEENLISLVIVGPEDPLAEGIVDRLTKQFGIDCFGPQAAAAKLESSKAFAKNFMLNNKIPSARFQTFTDSTKAKQHIMSCTSNTLVVKASGLAAGKGVVVADDKVMACDAVDNMLEHKFFGKAGEEVLIEERLHGEEVSCLAFTDGTHVACMPPTQDHKRLLDGDRGPNTGGMGAFCPYPKITKSEMSYIKTEILQKTVDTLRKDGIKYVGVLYAGIMLTPEGPKVLEFNCRFGDPETQVILPLMTSDLYLTCKACVNGSLQSHLPQFHPSLKSLGIVLVSDGYPGKYSKGHIVKGAVNCEQSTCIKVFHAGTKLSSSNEITTSGGRVLLVLGLSNSFESAGNLAKEAASNITFTGRFYRKDIGRMLYSQQSLTYKDSGVDISAGNNLVSFIKPIAAETTRPGVMNGIGSFGALFDLKNAGYVDPILVSGTDGVGTKLKVSQAVNRYTTIGIDLVAMCVNDVLVHGGEPLYFLDYFGCGRLEVSLARDVIKGIAEGCKQAGCALIGGETAEMPGLYTDSDYDIAGFAVGAVERKDLLPRLGDVQVGDTVIGLASSGLHSNGFSLVREVLRRCCLTYESRAPFDESQTIGEALLTPTCIYVKSVLPLLRSSLVKSVCHITGGGFLENLPRTIPANLALEIDAKSWTIPPVFTWLSQVGGISPDEMARTFNCGIGMTLITASHLSTVVVEKLRTLGECAFIIGKVIPNTGSQVNLNNLDDAFSDFDVTTLNGFKISPKRVAVLISGAGSNLQALIDSCRQGSSSAKISLVISNKADVLGLHRAKNANIPTRVIKHTDFSSREEFEKRIHEELVMHDIDIVCLAGFMRILTGWFVNKWCGRLLNTHPSLLPSFKGAHAHREVLAAGVRVTGCTIHFVAEEVDSGAILVQDTVPVECSDTEDSLAEKVKRLEHVAFPKALELVASGRAKLVNRKVQWNL